MKVTDRPATDFKGGLMALLDRVVGETIPPGSESARGKAREKALAFAKPDDWLALILTAHSNAEESVIYPALARAVARGGAAGADSPLPAGV
jgi:hypothetical protein